MHHHIVVLPEIAFTAKRSDLKNQEHTENDEVYTLLDNSVDVIDSSDGVDVEKKTQREHNHRDQHLVVLVELHEF